MPTSPKVCDMSKSAHTKVAEDPPPVPPVQPALEDCCRSGCTPCVFDLYEDAMDRYRAALKAWQMRNSTSKNARPPI